MVLTATLLRDGPRLRVNAQLVEAPSGSILWTENSEVPLGDIFALQDEVTQKIVAALEVSLAGEERARHKERGKVNGEAYDYFMRARSLLLQFNAAALLEARAMLGRALEIDPGLAQAYAYLAISYGTEYLNGWNNAGPDHLEKCLELARKAYETDDSEPLSCNAVAIALMWNRRLDEAEALARRAIELDPNFPDAYYLEAQALLGKATLGSDGKVQPVPGTVEALQKYLELDPNGKFAGAAKQSLELLKGSVQTSYSKKKKKG